MDREAWWATVCGVAESDMTEQLTLSRTRWKLGFQQALGLEIFKCDKAKRAIICGPSKVPPQKTNKPDPSRL